MQDFNGNMATQELYTEWGIDALPDTASVQTLYWQGSHSLRAVLTWMSA